MDFDDPVFELADAKAEIARHLPPENEHVRRGDLVAAIRDLALVAAAADAPTDQVLIRRVYMAFETGDASAQLVDVLAAKVHEIWVARKYAAGITSRRSADGEEQMVAYAQLSEPLKDLDRATVRAVLDGIWELAK